jgi:cobaltochelatase CobT
MERHEILQQKLEHWCAASVRALSDQPNVYFRGHHLIVKDKLFFLQSPYLQLDFSTFDNRKLRGVADSIALRLLHSNSDEHQARMPESIVEKIVFDQLEQLRCESLVLQSLPGMRTNLRTRFLFWAGQAAASSQVEESIGLLLFTITMVSWSRLHTQAIPENIEELIEATRWGFSDKVKHHLYLVNRYCDDQRQFATHALAIAKEVWVMIEAADSGQGEDTKLRGRLDDLTNNRNSSIRWLDINGTNLEQSYGVSGAQNICQVDQTSHYKVYTRAYDKVVYANKNIRAAQLAKLRELLDKRIRKQSINTNQVARYIKQLLSSPRRGGWEFDQEEGYLDSARLIKLVTSPNDHRLFKREKVSNASDCVVSIVVDNSGSMNLHNDVVAALVDTFTKALEMAGVETEILGFTTTEWNGGRVLKEWAKAGKPQNPGRLTSTCHTIYKAAENPWRRSRPAIAGMLKTDMFREGVDGEALQWALERIENRSEKNKIIMMISDGSPMDTATHAANSDRYLDQHLCLVTSNIERRPDVSLCALGVGLDLSAYYRESMSISVNDELNTKDFFKMAELLVRAQ